MKISDVPESACPVCGRAVVTFPSNAVPGPGDFAVCSGCTAILTYGSNVQAHLATAEEIKAAPLETKIELREVLRYLRRAVKAAQN
jgi:hypothetical protein